MANLTYNWAAEEYLGIYADNLVTLEKYSEVYPYQVSTSKWVTSDEVEKYFTFAKGYLRVPMQYYAIWGFSTEEDYYKFWQRYIN